MPRVKGLTTEQKIEYQRNVLTEHCEVLLAINKISKTKIAEYLSISPQAVAQQFKRKDITLPVLMAVVTLTDTNPSELKLMVKVGD